MLTQSRYGKAGAMYTVSWFDKKVKFLITVVVIECITTVFIRFCPENLCAYKNTFLQQNVTCLITFFFDDRNLWNPKISWLRKETFIHTCVLGNSCHFIAMWLFPDFYYSLFSLFYEYLFMVGYILFLRWTPFFRLLCKS